MDREPRYSPAATDALRALANVCDSFRASHLLILDAKHYRDQASVSDRDVILRAVYQAGKVPVAVLAQICPDLSRRMLRKIVRNGRYTVPASV